MKYLFDGVSLQNKRQTNMDSLLIKNGSIGNEAFCMVAVCDGVGTLVDGGFASAFAMKHLSLWMDSVKTTDRIGLQIQDVLFKINDCIVAQAKECNLQTASTLSVLLLVETGYYILHIGDSRIYSFAQKELICHTKDDVSQGGKLTGYLGKEKELYFQYIEGSAVGKVFLVCSDGLYKRMDMQFLASHLNMLHKSRIKEIVDHLAQYVIGQGERDNITVAIVKIES